MSNNPQPFSEGSAGLREDGDDKAAGLVRDLFDLAAAIKWIEGEVAAGATPAADALAAIERIQDIAFALRDCAIDAALCDALEAAIREIADAVARGGAAVERAHGASKLLPVLAKRINTMIAAAAADCGSNASADAPGASAIPRSASDLLAALRALSEEELIALFS